MCSSDLRIDTIYGSTFVMLGPEHPLINQLADRSPDPAGFKRKAQEFRLQDKAARVSGEIEKQGFDTGFTATNPFTNEPVPVWVANFVLGDYGTGAVMAVPAHDQRDFEFATKYALPITVVVQPEGPALRGEDLTAAYDGDGVLVGSGPYNGLGWEAANKKMTEIGRAHV